MTIPFKCQTVTESFFFSQLSRGCNPFSLTFYLQGYAESRIIRETIQVKFMGNAPSVFKPGLPFHFAVRS